MRKSGDPFEVDPLPRTFYYPSQQKVLPEDQRKICLSPNQRKEDNSKSPADAKFLQQIDLMKIHEIPTRENGTTDPNQSSSSKFDESWPSTERAMVSTPEADTEISGMSKTLSSEGSNVPLCLPSDSTLARYIHRFRNAPPSSRQARDHSYFHSGKGGEFWWLSPSPPTTSTPKEGTPPEGLLGPSPRPSLSPKLKRTVARRGASPLSPVSKARSTSSPSKSSVDGLDAKTADLQQRARTLLEKSESTLESSSSEAHIPKRKAKQEPQRERTSIKAPSLHSPPTPFIEQQRQLQPHPAPPPEEDILYQWRLARKMEKAQEQVAKWGPARSILPLGATQPHGLYGASQVLQTIPAPLESPLKDTAPQRTAVRRPPPLVAAAVPVGSSGLTTHNQTTFSMPTVAVSDKEVIPSQVIPSHTEVTSEDPTSSQLPVQVEQSSGRHLGARRTVQATTDTTEKPLVLRSASGSFVVEQDKLEPAEVPSHMHLSCDILPCPHQKALIEKGGTVKMPLSSPVVESILGKTNIEKREVENSTKAHRSVARESHDKRQKPKTKQNEFKDASSKVGPDGCKETLGAFPDDTVREKPKRNEAEVWKPKTRREKAKGSRATDVLSGVIGQVVSERLFSTPPSSTSGLTSSEESIVTRDPVQYHGLEQENANPGVSSDSEFPDDEVLKMLHQRARRYREQLRQIDSMLNQQTPRPAS